MKKKIVLNYNKLFWTSKLQTCLSFLSTKVEQRPSLEQGTLHPLHPKLGQGLLGTHWVSHTHLRHLCHHILPSVSTRTDLYSVCARGRWPWQYLVRTACQDSRATCDAPPRAESISEIHSSLSLIEPDARAAKSEKSRWQCSSRSCSGSVCRKPSIVSRIVSCAAAVRPFFASRWTVAFLYAHCAWVICRSRCMSPWAQKSANHVRFARWICCALCLTHGAHSWPSRKQTQPRRSWNHASTPSLEFGLGSEVSVCVSPASKYC